MAARDSPPEDIVERVATPPPEGHPDSQANKSRRYHDRLREASLTSLPLHSPDVWPYVCHCELPLEMQGMALWSAKASRIEWNIVEVGLRENRVLFGMLEPGRLLWQRRLPHTFFWLDVDIVKAPLLIQNVRAGQELADRVARDTRLWRHQQFSVGQYYHSRPFFRNEFDSRTRSVVRAEVVDMVALYCATPTPHIVQLRLGSDGNAVIYASLGAWTC